MSHERERREREERERIHKEIERRERESWEKKDRSGNYKDEGRRTTDYLDEKPPPKKSG